MKRIGATLIVLLLPLAGCVEPPEKEKKIAPLKELVTEDLRVGDGPEAKVGDRVRVHYVGTLRVNGKKFDSSHDAGEPFEFKLGHREVIRGWDEGVAGMKVGGKRKLEIPAKLAYGARGAGRDIPPNSDLVFEVELLEIVK